MTTKKLPLGWEQATFESLNHYVSSSVNPAEYPDERFELYSVPNFPTGQPEFQNGSAIGSTKQRVEPNDILVCKINPRINRVWKVAPKTRHTQIGSSEWIVFRSPLLCADFFKYYFRSPEFRQQLCEDVTGVGGSLTRAQPRKVAQFLLPVPPLAEQLRIADKLDALFAEINAARERLEQVPELLKAFREAVLEAAMSGELTRDWRGGKDAEWEETTLGEIADVVSGVTKDSRNQSLEDKEFPYLRVANVQRGYFDLNEVKTIRIPAEKAKNILLELGDILFNEGGDADKLGRGWVWEGQIENCSFQNHVFRARLRDPDNQPRYVSWWGNSRGSSYFLENAKQTVNLASINRSKLLNLPIDLPKADEQQEIVARIEALFLMADDLQERYDNAISSLNELEPTLLERAFKGELVAQGSTDEPANKLLKCILEVREAENAKRATMTKPKKPRKTPAEEPAQSLEQLVEQLQKLGGTATPEQLLNAANLRNPEGIEYFFDLIREGRNAQRLNIQPYEDGSMISVTQK